MAPLKSSLARSAKQLLGLRNTDDLGLRGAAQSTRQIIAPSFKASGGTKVDGSDGFTYHIFQKGNTDTFSITELAEGSNTVEVLLIGGGGGGGKQHGGGGAAGALYHNPSYPIPATADYTVTIGAGGASETSGSDSVFNDVTMKGGGRGGRMTQTGTAGGSGGGGGMDTTNPFPGTSATTGGAVTAPPTTPASSPLLHANAGGNGTGYYAYGAGGIGGGGGGAGGAGTSSPNGPGLVDPKSKGGEDYLFSSIPTPVMPEIAAGLSTPTVLLGVPLSQPENYKRAYAGGGGGGSHTPWGIYNPGWPSSGYGNHPDVANTMGGGSGNRTGGRGGEGNTEVGFPGVEGRGGGGGGSGQLPTNGGRGGAGVCIVKYATPS